MALGYFDTLVWLEVVPLFSRRPQLLSEKIVRSKKIHNVNASMKSHLQQRQGQLRAGISLHPLPLGYSFGPLGYGPAWNWRLEQMGNGSVYRTATGALVPAQSGRTESALRAYRCLPCCREVKLQVLDIPPQLPRRKLQEHDMLSTNYAWRVPCSAKSFFLPSKC